MGVKAIVTNVFDAQKLKKPDIVLHQLTDLLKGLPSEKMAEALRKNAILRKLGTKNLVEASITSGAKKMVTQSIGFIYENGTKSYDENSALLNFNDPVY